MPFELNDHQFINVLNFCHIENLYIASVYNGHLRGPVTLTPIAGRLAVSSGAVTTCLTKVCHGWDSNTQPSACGANALTHCSVAAVLRNKKTKVVVVIFYTEGRVL